MTCTEFLAQLDELLDEKIPGTMRADLEQHLRECEHCVITYSTTRKTIEIYQRHELVRVAECAPRPSPRGDHGEMQKVLMVKISSD